MGITVNASIGSGEGSGGTTLTYSHTLNAGSNRILVAGVMQDDGTAGEPTGVTYNAIALTHKIGVQSTGGAKARSDIYFLLETALPADGAHDILITYADTTTRKSGISVVLQSAKQETPEASGTDFTNGGTAISASITPITDNAMIVAIASATSDTNWAPGSGETEQLEVDSGGSHTSALNTKILVTAGATTMAPTSSASSELSLAAAAFAPLAVAGGLTPRSYPRGANRGLMRGVA